MLVGMLRLRNRDGTFFNLANVVWKQVGGIFLFFVGF